MSRSVTAGEGTDQDENCLTLNVWTPARDGSRRPVLVWIHGGGFIQGGAAAALYHGAHLATQGDVVVVTCNYRVGLLGFLAHPDFADPETGAWANWGLLDQIAALQWVRTNIASFGGDAENVTVFGESAGGISISTLYGANDASGLFDRGIAQSGPPQALPDNAAIRTAERVLDCLGLGDVAKLTDVPVSELLRVQRELTRSGGLVLRPVIDGGLLDRDPSAAIAEGRSRGVPLLIGTTRDEMRFFAAGDPRYDGQDASALEAMVAGTIGRDADAARQAIETYRAARIDRGQPATAYDIATAIQSDAAMRYPSIRGVERQSRVAPVWMYMFDFEARDPQLGACHALDVPFTFGNRDAPNINRWIDWDSDALQLARALQDAWVSFARTGDPSTASLPWPRFDTERRATMGLGSSQRVINDPMAPEREFWDGL